MTLKDVGFLYATVEVIVTSHTRLHDIPEAPRQWHANLEEEQGEAMITYLIKNYGFVEKLKDTEPTSK